ncbi:hypothetical protein BC938DRAFT_475205 [Jimgerdemannia flammicorona]|uniref:Uncharacterized protein n=1 Tax=Jimgerdemannia flammicorona TaxID=994334 RepID=A0A433QRT8_9FUNG|nr:hypothetical protein BC938DRAFT_475205 [Jimgerdemannia flammicorona]
MNGVPVGKSIRKGVLTKIHASSSGEEGLMSGGEDLVAQIFGVHQLATILGLEHRPGHYRNPDRRMDRPCPDIWWPPVACAHSTTINAVTKQLEQYITTVRLREQSLEDSLAMVFVCKGTSHSRIWSDTHQQRHAWRAGKISGSASRWWDLRFYCSLIYTSTHSPILFPASAFCHLGNLRHPLCLRLLESRAGTRTLAPFHVPDMLQSVAWSGLSRHEHQDERPISQQGSASYRRRPQTSSRECPPLPSPPPLFPSPFLSQHLQCQARHNLSNNRNPNLNRNGQPVHQYHSIINYSRERGGNSIVKAIPEQVQDFYTYVLSWSDETTAMDKMAIATTAANFANSTKMSSFLTLQLWMYDNGHLIKVKHVLDIAGSMY